MKTKTFLLALLAQLFTLTASAYDAKVGSIYYNLDNTNRTASVTHNSYNGNYNSYSGNISIPTVITYNNVSYRVTEIEINAFKDCTSLTSVIIPSSIESIDAQAFENSTALTSLTIPSSVKTIGSRAFNGCTSLTSLTIPTSVIYIDYEAFEETPWYTNWYSNQPDGFCYINNVLYRYKGSMSSGYVANVPDGTVCIGGSAFENQTNLASVVMAESCTYIGGMAFKGCNSLKSIIWPQSLKRIAYGAFENCISLEYVDVPMCESLGAASFRGCSELSLVTLSEGISILGDNLFRGCTNMTSITLPSTITKIYTRSFQNCNNLTTVKVGMTTPITIDSEVFTNRFLATLYVPEGCKAAYEAAEYWQDFQEIIEGSPVDEADLLFYTGTTEAQANSQVTLSIKLANSVAVQSFAFDLALPEGVTVALDEDDFEMVTLSTERTTTKKTNVFDFYTNADGSLHVEASSTRGYTLDDEDGEVVQVLLNIGKDTKDGDYPLTFQNITITDGEGNEHHPETSTSTLTVLPNHPYDLNGDGQVSIADVTLIVNYILGR